MIEFSKDNLSKLDLKIYTENWNDTNNIIEECNNLEKYDLTMVYSQNKNIDSLINVNCKLTTLYIYKI